VGAAPFARLKGETMAPIPTTVLWLRIPSTLRAQLEARVKQNKDRGMNSTITSTVTSILATALAQQPKRVRR
jgi:hypothetical protein